jgi:hypothetical protein
MPHHQQDQPQRHKNQPHPAVIQRDNHIGNAHQAQHQHEDQCNQPAAMPTPQPGFQPLQQPGQPAGESGCRLIFTLAISVRQ